MKKISKSKTPVQGKGKVEKVIKEYKSGTLHTGSKTGPVVKNKKQAIAIGLSEQRKKDAAKKKKKMI